LASHKKQSTPTTIDDDEQMKSKAWVEKEEGNKGKDMKW
jgi:hypothetical protein